MLRLTAVLDTLEKTFGKLEVPARARAFDMLALSMCGYPASDAACAKGWASLRRDVGTSAEAILGATKAQLTRALRAGGMVPDLRAERLKLVATQARAGADFGDRKTLKKLPTIGDPGADKILLFTRKELIAAVPSNAVQVPLRIGFGTMKPSYSASYRSAQQALDSALPKTYEARIRAYLLLKRHGQDVCKRSRPRCDACPLTRGCRYFAQSPA